MINSSMIKRFFNFFKSEEGQQDFYTPKDVEIVFRLTYRQLEIGTLRLNAGVWAFQYSEMFKQQTGIKPLIDFPNVHKTYISADLSPFFMQRIPGSGQNVQKVTQQNEVDLLKNYGRQTISNPFVLQALQAA
jgi:hypothetical protein